MEKSEIKRKIETDRGVGGCRSGEQLEAVDRSDQKWSEVDRSGQKWSEAVRNESIGLYLPTVV